MFDLRSLRDAQSSSALLQSRVAADAGNRKQMPFPASTVGSNRVLGVCPLLGVRLGGTSGLATMAGRDQFSGYIADSSRARVS